jgi:hypothetical protein
LHAHRGFARRLAMPARVPFRDHLLDAAHHTLTASQLAYDIVATMAMEWGRVGSRAVPGMDAMGSTGCEAVAARGDRSWRLTRPDRFCRDGSIHLRRLMSRS